MTTVRKMLACAALLVGGLLVAASPAQAHWPFSKHEPVQAPIYAAPEYGAPVTVPMARNVHEEYVYSWGVPSSQVRRIQHGQYSQVSASASYNSASCNGSHCGGGDCGNGCGSKCGRCGCSLGGLFKCRHRSCNSGCEPKPCGKPACGSKCGGCKGLFGGHHGCKKSCEPKCSKPCEKPCSKPCRKPCSTPCRKTCDKPCHAKCGSAPKCGGCRSSSNCCFSLFGCRHRSCSSGCASGGTWVEGAEMPSDSGAMPEEVPGPAPAEELPPPVPQASHTIESSVSTPSVAVETEGVSDSECARPVKVVSHWQDAKCSHCNGELRPLYGAKQIAGGAFRLICPKCKRYYVLTPTPSPITSTDQMGYYYARVPR